MKNLIKSVNKFYLILYTKTAWNGCDFRAKIGKR